LQREASAILAERDAQAINDRLRAFLTDYEPGPVNYKLPAGEILWRARPCRDRNGFPRIADVHYPHLNAPAGRCNEPGSPLLYVCFTTFTALYEKGAKAGDFVQMICYSIHRPVRALTLGEFTNAHKRGLGLVSADLSQAIHEFIERWSFPVKLSLVFMDAFLAGILADPDAAQNTYMHSRTLTKLLFEKYPGIEAIHYPSVAREGSMNLAIKPAVADEALRVFGTSVMHIDRQYDYGLYDYRIVRNAHVDPNAKRAPEIGEVEWRELDYKPSD
jgi:RES domain-containing protein